MGQAGRALSKASGSAGKHAFRSKVAERSHDQRFSAA